MGGNGVARIENQASFELFLDTFLLSSELLEKTNQGVSRVAKSIENTHFEAISRYIPSPVGITRKDKSEI